MLSRFSAQRIQPSLLSPLERPLLLWLAARMPRSITPNGLTLTGLLGAALTFLSYVLARDDAVFLWFASAGLALNWFGDSLDGTLARYRRAERPRYGFFLDNVTDLFAQLLVGLGLALCGYLRPEAAGFTLIVYLMIVAATAITQSVTGEMAQSVMLVGPTEVRLLLIGLNAWLFWSPPPPLMTLGVPLTILDLGAFGIGLLGLAALALRALSTARKLARTDPGHGLGPP